MPTAERRKQMEQMRRDEVSKLQRCYVVIDRWDANRPIATFTSETTAMKLLVEGKRFLVTVSMIPGWSFIATYDRAPPMTYFSRLMASMEG